jgi:hypothetical protein
LLVARAIAAALLVACNHSEPSPDFIVARTDRQITGRSKFPVAIDPVRVGTYPARSKSGAGYFYGEVLECRVWMHPKNGAQPLNSTHDYFAAFAQYEAAEEFSKKVTGAESPLVLVRQLEWIHEPKRGHLFR